MEVSSSKIRAISLHASIKRWFGGSVVRSMNEATSLRQFTKPVEIQECDLKLFACSCSGGTIIKPREPCSPGIIITFRESNHEWHLHNATESLPIMLGLRPSNR